MLYRYGRGKQAATSTNDVQCNVMQWMVMQYLLPCVCLVSLKSDGIAIIILYIKNYAIAILPIS